MFVLHRFSLHRKDAEEAAQWCHDNVKGYYRIVSTHYVHVMIHDAQDAMLMKLTWCGRYRYYWSPDS